MTQETDRDREVARNAERWKNHGDRQWLVSLPGARSKLIWGYRVTVSNTGDLIFYSKFKEKPEEMLCAFAPGSWITFWMMNLTDGAASCLLDDSDWWKDK